MIIIDIKCFMLIGLPSANIAKGENNGKRKMKFLICYCRGASVFVEQSILIFGILSILSACFFIKAELLHELWNADGGVVACQPFCAVLHNFVKLRIVRFFN